MSKSVVFNFFSASIGLAIGLIIIGITSANIHYYDTIRHTLTDQTCTCEQFPLSYNQASGALWANLALLLLGIILFVVEIVQVVKLAKVPTAQTVTLQA